MPKFTQEELEEIRKNTEAIEAARKEKQSSKKKKKAPTKKRTKKVTEFSLKERLIPLVILAITLGVSYLVVLLF
jgi:cell division protein FtsL